MKALLTLTGILSAIAIAAPVALAGPFITDTLGGNGHAKTAVQGYRIITDTLGGNGHAGPAVQGYRFITDTLAPGGGSTLAAAPSSPGFNWTDAGVGAGVVAGALLVLAGGLLVVRRRDAIPV
jgi:hypothetical protein